MTNIVEMQGIVKRFSGILANDHVDFQLEKGEIHALLGENGAGKSTLMNVLFGINQPDDGVIKIRGQETQITSPLLANNLGIGMVHQHFMLVENFTVMENIVLGAEPKRSFGRINWKEAEATIRSLSKRYGLAIDPFSRIEDISVGSQQRVEILKMLYRDAEVLILDEPTAVLTPQEIQELIKVMRELVAEGKSIIIITHKLKEIKAVADRCTVLRRGKKIDTVDVASVDTRELATLMVGREVNFKVDKQKNEAKPPATIIKNLTVRNQRDLIAVEDLSLSVSPGEIVAIAGIEGNGQSELIEALTGLRKIESGSVTVNGVDITHKTVREKTEAGIGHIPEDRHKHGLVLEFTINENIVLQTYYKEPYSKRGILQEAVIKQHADALIKEFDVRSGRGGDSFAGELSGGNQQKAIIAREIDRSPLFLIVAQPTRGLDVGAIEFIHKRIVQERDAGRAVLLVTLDLDEAMDVSDRIEVIYKGKIVGSIKSEDADENIIGMMMAGSNPTHQEKETHEN